MCGVFNIVLFLFINLISNLVNRVGPGLLSVFRVSNYLLGKLVINYIYYLFGLDGLSITINLPVASQKHVNEVPLALTSSSCTTH